MPSLQGSGGHDSYPQLPARTDSAAVKKDTHRVSWFDEEEPREEPELRLGNGQKDFNVKWEDEEPEIEDDFDLEEDKGKDIDSLLNSLLPSDASRSRAKTPKIKGPKIKPRTTSK
jgi:hypothetical protein